MPKGFWHKSMLSLELPMQHLLLDDQRLAHAAMPPEFYVLNPSILIWIPIFQVVQPASVFDIRVAHFF